MSTAPVAAAVLAAGGSRRLGHPKQLLVWEGRTLLRRAVESALAGGASPVICVLGAEAERCLAEIADLPVHAVVNESWSEGMAGSIGTAVAALGELAPAAPGLLLLPCDQPLVTTELLARLIDESGATLAGPDSGRPVACSYAGVVGPPAVFPASLFSELAALRGDTGARALLERHAAELVLVDFPGGASDIDRGEDFEKLASRGADSPGS